MLAPLLSGRITAFFRKKLLKRWKLGAGRDRAPEGPARGN